MSRGRLVIISGSSGVGKGTVVKELVKKDGCSLSISATTRDPRKGDVNGVNYFFKTREEFEQMIRNDELLEYAEYVGNYYGTPVKYVDDELDKGKHVILEIEMQGALKVKEKRPDALMIFIVPPGYEELRERLINRGTEDAAAIKRRLARAKEETDFLDRYDFIVVNEDKGVDKCAEEIHNIINDPDAYLTAEKKAERDALIERIRTDFGDS
jgi:guanylate kinase